MKMICRIRTALQWNLVQVTVGASLGSTPTVTSPLIYQSSNLANFALTAFDLTTTFEDAMAKSKRKAVMKK